MPVVARVGLRVIRKPAGVLVMHGLPILGREWHAKHLLSGRLAVKMPARAGRNAHVHLPQNMNASIKSSASPRGAMHRPVLAGTQIAETSR